MRLEKIMNNFHALKMGDVTIWFSYETPIAFKTISGTFVRENLWGITTGKHLNHINTDHSVRLKGEQFERMISNEVRMNDMQ